MRQRTRVTLEDVARRAGVSRATASRVVRGDVAVSDQKSRAVAAAVDELRYTPNTAARALVTHRTGMIAVIIPEPDELVFTDPFFARVVVAVSVLLEQWDLQLVMSFADLAGRGARTAAFLGSGAVDGAIVVSHHQVDGQVEAFAAAPVPVVFIGRPVTADPPASWVDSDNVGGGRLAAEHLLDAGARRPAIVTGPLDMVAAQDRLRGFSEALAEHGIDPVVLEGAFTAQSGREAAEALAPSIRSGAVDAVFLSSDLMAVAALDAWEEVGICVPDDVLVVSFDDSPAAERAGLSSVTNSAERLGQQASVMLHDILDKTWDGQPVTRPVTLTTRRSSRRTCSPASPGSVPPTAP